MLRLLCVTAHPDDEAGLFGGTLLLYRRRCVETHVICLTPGQAARHRGGFEGSDELAAVRRRELAASCSHLEVTHCEVLNFRDGRLDQENLYEVVGELVLRFRQLRPHVVITFGSEGAVTAHTDHGMASMFATLAFQWAARTNRYPEQLNDSLRPWRSQKLYYGTSAFTMPDRQPVALAPASAFIDIGESNLQRKIEAFKMHTTQAPLFELFESHTRKRGYEERFALAASAVPREIERETDLFEGVEEA
ncbi:MAG TPA: PIG-L family deacetylase [Terriglobales bacterium]|nr:PIG-L family deacetylase [Terriglobales bacterium]